MEQAVQDGGGDGGIVVEDARPVFVRLVGSDDGGALFVTAADDLKELIRAGFVDGQITQLIEHQQSRSKELFEFVFEPCMGLGGAEGINGFDGRGKEHRVALEAGSMAQGGGQMRFAQADTADEDHTGLVFEEGQAEEGLPLRLIGLFGPGPVKLLEGFDNRKTRGGHASNDLPLVAALGFPFNKLGQVLDRGPLLAGGFIGPGPVMVLTGGNKKGLWVWGS